MLRKFLPAAAIIALTSGLALAQPASSSSSSSGSLGIPLSVERPPTPEEIEKQKAADRAYSDAMQKIPDKKPSADPWGNIRSGSPNTAKNKPQ
jgi:hypothetical protein